MSRAKNVAIEYRWAENQVDRPLGAGGRTGSTTGRRDRDGPRLRCDVRSQDGNHDHSHRIHRRRGPMLESATRICAARFGTNVSINAGRAVALRSS